MIPKVVFAVNEKSFRRDRRQPPATGAAVQDRAEAWLREWQALGKRIEAESADPRSCVETLLADRR